MTKKGSESVQSGSKGSKNIVPIVPSYNAQGFAKEIRSMSPLQALAEKAQNALDALSRYVFIQIMLGKDRIIVRDQGTGMTDKELAKYFELLTSGFAQKETARGTNGLGSKYIFTFANRETIRTSPFNESDSDVYVFSYTFDQLLQWIFGGKREKFYPQVEKRNADDPKTGSFATFILEGLNPETMEYFDESFLLSEMTKLFPWCHDQIFINDKPLVQPQIKGEVIRDSLTDPNLGEVKVILMAPESDINKVFNGELNLGTKGPVEDLIKFVNRMPLSLRKKVPTIFFQGLVGLIDIQAFKSYRNPQSTAFTKDIFYSPQFALFLRYLQVLSKKAERILTIQDQVTTEATAKAVDLLKKVFAGKYGKVILEDDDKTPVDKPNILEYVTLTIGESLVFNVSLEGVLIWDDSESGGQLNKTTGNEVTYTAGMVPGKYMLKIVQKDFSLSEAFIRITIVEKKTFMINPTTAQLLPGESRYFRIKDKPEGVKKVSWQEKGCGGKIQIIDDDTIILVAGKTLGRFTITATCQGGKLKAESEIIIVEKKPIRKRKGDKEAPNIVKIEETFWEVAFKPLKGLKDVSKVTPSNVAENSLLITFNTQHIMFQRQQKTSFSSWWTFLLDEIVMRHVLRQDDLTSTEIATKISSIKQDIFS